VSALLDIALHPALLFAVALGLVISVVSRFIGDDEDFNDDGERAAWFCEECGTETFTDNPLCAECSAGEDCGMVVDGGIYLCTKDGSEECCFLCPYHDLIGEAAESEEARP
jgi:hypothetical protein